MSLCGWSLDPVVLNEHVSYALIASRLLGTAAVGMGLRGSCLLFWKSSFISVSKFLIYLIIQHALCIMSLFLIFGF
jgi:hypothetical protein